MNILRILRGGCALITLAVATAATGQTTGQSVAADPGATPPSADAPAIASAAPPAAESPSEGLEEIVVTAQRRSENLQRVPVSVSAISARDLQTQGINSVVAIQAITPGLQITTGGGNIQPFVRGIGTTANGLGNESSVAVYADGVYFTRLPIGFFSLANIDRVEVLKGPQGTLFGRNSSGGVIQIVTPDPSFNAEARGSLGYGNYDTPQGSFYATGPLSDKVAADIAISGQKTRDGYGRNIVTGDRANPLDFFTARSKLLFQPSDATKLLLTGFYSYSRSGGLGNIFPGKTQGYETPPFSTTPFLTLPGFWDQRGNRNNRSYANAEGVSLRIEQDVSFAKLISITAYTHTKDVNSLDSDYLDRPDFYAKLPGLTKQFTQELQLASNPESAVKWLVGAFYYNTLSKYTGIRFEGLNFFPEPFTDNSSLNIFSRQRAKSYALYGQASYEVLPKLTLTGGLRYTIDKLRGSGSLVVDFGGTLLPATVLPAGSDEVKKLTYRAAADFQVDPNALLYASISRGYKSSGFNLIPFSAVPTKPEILDAYEIGAKTNLFDRRVRLNVAAFWYDVKNPQVQLLNSGSLFLSNAGSSRTRGAELEGQALLFTGFTARFGGSYLDSKYRDYENAPSGEALFVPPYGTINPLITINAKGNRTPYAPKFTGNVGFDYRFAAFDGDFTLTGDYYYNDGYVFEPDNYLKQSSYSQFSGQVMYAPNANLAFRVFGRNLTNKKVVAFSSAQAGPAGYPFIPAPPRTYGVAVDFKF